MEEKQLTVYKKGEVQTVHSPQDYKNKVEVQHLHVANTGTTTTLSTELGDCEIRTMMNGECQSRMEARTTTPERFFTGWNAASPVGCVTDSQPEMESVDLVTKNNQTELRTLNSREDGTVSSTLPKLPQENVISSSPETLIQEIIQQLRISVLKTFQSIGRTLTRPQKMRKILAELTALMDHSPDDDTYRSRLRQRSVNEGGPSDYTKEWRRSCRNEAIPKSTVQQVWWRKSSPL